MKSRWLLTSLLSFLTLAVITTDGRVYDDEGGRVFDPAATTISSATTAVGFEPNAADEPIATATANATTTTRTSSTAAAPTTTATTATTTTENDTKTTSATESDGGGSSTLNAEEVTSTADAVATIATTTTTRTTPTKTSAIPTTSTLATEDRETITTATEAGPTLPQAENPTTTADAAATEAATTTTATSITTTTPITTTTTEPPVIPPLYNVDPASDTVSIGRELFGLQQRNTIVGDNKPDSIDVGLLPTDPTGTDNVLAGFMAGGGSTEALRTTYVGAGAGYIHQDVMTRNRVVLPIVDGATAVGFLSSARTQGTAVGNYAMVNVDQGTAIGSNARVSGRASTAIGYGARVKSDYSIVLGGDGSSFFSPLANVGIGTATPHFGASLDLGGKTPRGLVLNRVTTAQRNNQLMPVEGMIVYDRDLKDVMVFTDLEWKPLSPLPPPPAGPVQNLQASLRLKKGDATITSYGNVLTSGFAILDDGFVKKLAIVLPEALDDRTTLRISIMVGSTLYDQAFLQVTSEEGTMGMIELASPVPVAAGSLLSLQAVVDSDRDNLECAVTVQVVTGALPAPSLPPPLEPEEDPTERLTFGLQSSCHINDQSRFNICIDMTSTLAEYQRIAARALARWEEVIVGDSGGPFNIQGHPEVVVGTGLPNIVDDIHMVVGEVDEDGPEGVLGWAMRTLDALTGFNPRTGTPYVHTVSGMFVIDSADIEMLLSIGGLDNVLIHEMGHLLGINGDSWEQNGLYTPGSGEYEPDSLASVAYRESPGCTGGVPVELEGDPGTADSHWDEAIMTNELMTGWLDSVNNPLSSITVNSLADMGYEVNVTAADPYTVPNCSRRRRRGLRGSSNQRLQASHQRRKLSPSGKSKVLAFAGKKLKEAKDKAPKKVASGLKYVADLSMVVLFMEDGHIHDVPVTWDEVEASVTDITLPTPADPIDVDVASLYNAGMNIAY